MSVTFGFTSVSEILQGIWRGAALAVRGSGGGRHEKPGAGNQGNPGYKGRHVKRGGTIHLANRRDDLDEVLAIEEQLRQDRKNRSS